MGAVLFGREYELRFGLPGQEGVSLRGGVDPDTGYTVGYDLSFSVSKTAKRSSNKATITVHNLSADQIGLLEEKGTVIQLIAGYPGNAALIFSGKVTKGGVKSEWVDGKTRTTTIEAGDAELEMAKTRANLSLASGATNHDALRALLKAMGVGEGNLSDVPVRTLLGGFYHAGWAREAITQLCDDTGFDWSLQDGEFQALAPSAVRAGVEAVLLNEMTGLIGSPKREKTGVTADSLLQPKLAPGGLVRVEARDFAGDYKITEVTHAGEFPRGGWVSNVKGKARE